MKVCAGRLEDADLPSRSHSDGLKKTRNCWDSGGNQQPGHHSDVISQCPCKPQIRVFKRVTCEVKVSTKCHIIVHITCSSSSSSAGDRSSDSSNDSATENLILLYRKFGLLQLDCLK